MPNGESYEMVKDRISDFLADLKKNYDEKHIAIVAHQGPQLALDVLLKRRTWKQAIKEDWRNKKAWQPPAPPKQKKLLLVVASFL